MRPSDELLLYQQLDTYHSSMLDAACQLRWEAVVSLQVEIDKTVSLLAGLPTLPLSADQRRQKAALIRQILEKQTIVRREIADWQEDVKPLLATFDKNETRPTDPNANRA